MKIIFGLFILLGIVSCGDNKENHVHEHNKNDSVLVMNDHKQGQLDSFIHVEPIQYEQLLSRLASTSDTLYVVNFWATWCKPCVAELPDFFKWYGSVSNKKIAFIMVTLDTKGNLESNVIPFLKKNRYQTEHYLLDDNGRMNEWIPIINNKWEGDIPATAFYVKGKQVHFINGSIDENKLTEISKQYF